jgi:hypothetical protein
LSKSLAFAFFWHGSSNEIELQFAVYKDNAFEQFFAGLINQRKRTFYTKIEDFIFVELEDSFRLQKSPLFLKTVAQNRDLVLRRRHLFYFLKHLFGICAHNLFINFFG